MTRSQQRVRRIDCLALGNCVNNVWLNCYVTNPGSGGTQLVSTASINTRNGFGGFIGDYTDLAVGFDNVFHAIWTDSNNKQNAVWF